MKTTVMLSSTTPSSLGLNGLQNIMMLSKKKPPGLWPRLPRKLLILRPRFWK